MKFSPAMQTPFHFLGGAPKPSSWKLADSGQIPVSRTPMMTSLSAAGLWLEFSLKPIKSQDLVIRRWRVLLGKTDTTPFMPG